MIITVHTPFAGPILIIKDGAPIGLIIEIDTEKKTYIKVKYPVSWFMRDPDLEQETGSYDRAVLCPNEHDIPERQLLRFMEAGIEMLGQDEMDELRREIQDGDPLV